MAPTPTRVMDVCTDLLGAVIANHGGEVPGRTYVAAGAPAWDCELLATWCERTYCYDGDVAVEVREPKAAAASHAMRAGTFVVTLLRCTPAVPTMEGVETIVLPTVEQEEAAATLLYEDNQRIVNALREAERDGALGSCGALAFLDWRSLGPFGGLVAGEQRVAVGLSQQF